MIERIMRVPYLDSMLYQMRDLFLQRGFSPEGRVVLAGEMSSYNEIKPIRHEKR